MTTDEMVKKVKDLGIVMIEPSGEFSKALVEDAIKTAEGILSDPSLDEIAADIDQREKEIDEILK